MGSETGTVPCGTFYDRYHPKTTEVWTRSYSYTVGFTYSYVETKRFFHKANNVVRDFIVDHWSSSREEGLSSESQLFEGAPCKPNDSACIYGANLASRPLNDNQWYCIETHVKENTPGQADGMVERWVEGVQTMNETGHTFRGPDVNGINGNSFNYTMDVLRLYTQLGNGLMYYDDFAVGPVRIGCTGGSTLPGTTPPLIPTGVEMK